MCIRDSTGNLGDVMKESALAAMSYIRSHAQQLHIPTDFYKTKDIHCLLYTSVPSAESISPK